MQSIQTIRYFIIDLLDIDGILNSAIFKNHVIRPHIPWDKGNKLSLANMQCRTGKRKVY